LQLWRQLFKNAKGTPLVALIKVTKYLTFDTIYNEIVPMSMEVEVINKYKGKKTLAVIVFRHYKLKSQTNLCLD
jgi:hypothetical protein